VVVGLRVYENAAAYVLRWSGGFRVVRSVDGKVILDVQDGSDAGLNRARRQADVLAGPLRARG
jgi:hypothetical protein